jgi:hypothetical protein
MMFTGDAGKKAFPDHSPVKQKMIRNSPFAMISV